ncbi:MAG: putative ABC exporter domain-containing protein, partial [Bacteroidales bacterium]
MNGPFLYLFACSTKNRVVARMRRLREPRYLVGAVVGSVYLYAVFLRNRFGKARRAARLVLPASALGTFQLAGTLAVWVVVLARWFIPVSRQPLELTGAERDLLLTAPVARRAIIRYKLLRSQAAILLSTALILVFAWTSVVSAWSFLLGVFLLFATLRVHLLGVALARQSFLTGYGRRDPAAWAALAVAVLATIAAVSVAAPAVLNLARTGQLEPSLALARARASTPLASLGLLPFAVVVRPALAAWPVPFLLAAVPALALMLLNYAWVLRAEGMLQESSEAGERDVVRGTRVAPPPTDRRSPFVLTAHGAPEWALVWKNLIMLGRYVTPRTLLRVSAPLVVLAVVAGSHRSAFASGLYPLAIAVTCGLALIGPYSFRNDLRQDLSRLPALKSWPISGERLLWGEILAPWLVLTTLVGLLIILSAVLSMGVPAAAFAWRDRLALVVSGFFVLPAIALAQVVIQNAAVVLFPGWVAVGPSRPRGVEAMGQQMLMFAGTFLLLVVGLLPGTAVALVI